MTLNRPGCRSQIFARSNQCVSLVKITSNLILLCSIYQILTLVEFLHLTRHGSVATNMTFGGKSFTGNVLPNPMVKKN